MKERSIMHKSVFALTLGVAWTGLAASVDAQIPWYVNPARKAQVSVGAEAFESPTLRLSADGGWLGFAAASDGAGRVAAFRMADLAALDAADAVTDDAGISGAASDLGLGEGRPHVLASGTLGAAVAWRADGTAAAALPNGALTYRRWTKRFRPVRATVPADAGALALNAAGDRAWSAASDGRLVAWSVSGNAADGSLAFAPADVAWETGLASVADVAVYALGGTDAALVCGGREVALVGLADGAERTTLLSDLVSDAVAARLSHADTWRPRLYVLTADGALAVHVFAADERAIDEKWTKTLPAADLCALAGWPEGTKAAAFDVSADGTTLVLAPADGSVLAVVRHEPKVWCYWTDDADGFQYVSDGNWKLRCWNEWGKVAIGTGWETENAFANDYVGEYLDFSSGVATNAASGERMRIMGHRTKALGVTANGGPRVIVFSPEAEDVGDNNQFMKGWDPVEEVVINAVGMTRVDSWAGFAACLRRVVLNLPGVTTLADHALRGEPAWPCGGTDVAAWDLSALKTVGTANFFHTDIGGVLDLPVVETLGGSAFEECHFLTEVRLGAEAKTVQAIGSKVLSVTDQGGERAGGRLKKLVLGGVDGFAIGADAFGGQPLEEVVFTGGVPTFADGFAFTDTAARTMFFAVPRGDAKWAAALAGKVTELSDAERRAIQKANPDRPMPFGVVAADAFRTAHEQYVCDVAEAARCRVTVEHDAFFGDAVEVSSDLAPGADGTYAAGTIPTLTPKPSATGTFRKWYGDVPNGMCAETPLTLVVSNDVWVLARFTHPWTLAKTDDPRKMLASNGNFTINCTVKGDARERLLGLGDGSVHGLFADSDEGQGTLDLGGEVRLEGDATPWKFIVYEGWDWSGTTLIRQKHGKGDVSTFISPGTAIDLPGGGFLDVPATGEASYETFVFDEPKMSGEWTSWAWSAGRQTKLTRLILQTPNLTAAFDNSDALRGLPLTETKFDWWSLTGLTSLASHAWKTAENLHAPALGTLRLPSLCVVQKEALAWMPNVEAIELGGLKKKAFVTEIGANAFARDPKLRSLKIRNAADMTVGDAPFEGGATPREIVLTGPAIRDGGAAFAALTSGVEAAETKPVVICVSALMWSGTPYIDTSVSEAERAQLPGEEILGVYRGGAEAPLGKALVVKRPSPFDPRGIAVVIR